MRKSIIDNAHAQKPARAHAQGNEKWLDLEKLAVVELTSEDPEYPIEQALNNKAEPGAGWRAAQSGEQAINIRFDAPQNLRHIQLTFIEEDLARTQEFVLRW